MGKPITSKRQRFLGSRKMQDKLIELVSGSANIQASCRELGISRVQVYALKKTDEDFAARLNEAYTLGVEALEDEATRRAVEGVDEPVFYKGEVCGFVTKFSDSLLMFKLRGAKPEKYAINRNEVYSPRGSSLNLAHSKAEELTDEELLRIISGDEEASS